MANSSGSSPSSHRLKMAGRSLLRVRSPDAPKITKTQGSARFDMAAELRPQCREQFFRERVVAPRSEPRVQCGRQYVRRDFFFDCCIDGPPPLPRIGDASGELLELRVCSCPLYTSPSPRDS